MRKYFLFSWLQFLNLIEYRLNFMWEIFGTLITMLMLYVFWVAILGSGFVNSPYTRISIGLYYLFITFLNTVSFSNYWRIANLINSGDLSMEIVKPYRFFLKEFVQLIPYKLIQTLVFLFIITLISVLGILDNFTLTNVLLFTTSSIFAIVGKFYIALSLGGLGFWFKRVHGFGSLFWNLGGLFSGELIPVDLLPHTLLAISTYLPFRYLSFFPVQVILGKSSQTETSIGLIVQLLWVGLFILITRWIWKRGLSQYDASGR